MYTVLYSARSSRARTSSIEKDLPQSVCKWTTARHLKSPKSCFHGHRLRGRARTTVAAPVRRLRSVTTSTCGGQEVVVPAPAQRLSRPHRIADGERHVQRVHPTGTAAATDHGPSSRPAARHRFPRVHVQRYHLGLVVTARGRRGSGRGRSAVVRPVHLVRGHRFVPDRPVVRDDHVLVVRITERAEAGGRGGRAR